MHDRRPMTRLALALAGLLLTGTALPASPQRRPAPPVDPATWPEPVRQAEERVRRMYDQMRYAMASGSLSDEQKRAIGRIWAEVEAMRRAAGHVLPDRVDPLIREFERAVPRAAIEAGVRKLQPVFADPYRRESAVFDLDWPPDLLRRWETLLDEMRADLEADRAAHDRARDALRQSIGDRYGVDLAVTPDHPTPQYQQARRAFEIATFLDWAQRPAYPALPFDRKVLEQPDLTPDQRDALAVRILYRTYAADMPDAHWVKAFPRLGLTADQRDYLWHLRESVIAELTAEIEAGAYADAAGPALRAVYQDRIQQRLVEDDPWTPEQHRWLFVADALPAWRNRIGSLGVLELPADRLDDVIRIIQDNRALHERIPRTEWAFSPEYQAESLRLGFEMARIFLDNDSLDPALRRPIARQVVRLTVPRFALLFTTYNEQLLDSWPILFPGQSDLFRLTSPHSLTPQHWVWLYQKYLKVWPDAYEGRCRQLAAMIRSRIGHQDEADTLQAEATDIIDDAVARFCELIYRDPRFTPVQKVLIFEAEWNSIGPFEPYFSALPDPPSRRRERLGPLLDACREFRSYPPVGQYVFSLPEVCGRQQRSLLQVHRQAAAWPSLTDDERQRLDQRYALLSRRLAAWARGESGEPPESDAATTRSAADNDHGSEATGPEVTTPRPRR